MSFAKAFELVLNLEGGFSNNPADKGGRTMGGITQKTYDAWRVRNGLLYADVAGITRDEEAIIYREMYWETTGCEFLPELIGIAIFDIAVNSGPSNAIRIMQRLAGVTNDGILGPKTKAAFAAVGGTSSLLMDVTDARMSFYCKIVQRDTSQVIFIDGWIRRARNLERSLLGM